MLRLIVAAFVALVTSVLATLPMPALAAKVELSGEVTYRERIALPNGATLRVRLIDMTAPRMPTRVEAEAAIASPGQVPLTFTLNFDDRVIDRSHGYAIVAEISSGLELWFRNSTPYAVDPLAPAEAVVVIVNFVGRLVEPTPAPVEDEPAAAPSILDITWRADTIAGEPAAANVDSTLSIASDMRAGGRGGCNSYFAQAEVGAETVRFSAIAATRMACLSATITAQEEAFFASLGVARFYRLDDGQLVLLDGRGGEIIRFSKAAR